VFGYHEVFHLMVIGGSALHYIVVAGWLMRA
jgi:predicted membrane channel-forming protein YqfA (hemolysin III family)